MRILYVLTQYPKLSETFVLQEIALLREMGHDVWACPSVIHAHPKPRSSGGAGSGSHRVASRPGRSSWR